MNDPNFVNARDRIGPGPWQNAKGVAIAKDIEELHSANNNITKETALDEKGQIVNGRTETPNTHDILTGSRPDGTAFAGAFLPDMTCGNWTKNETGGSAMLGHQTARALSGVHGPYLGIHLTRRLAAIRRVWRRPAARAFFTASQKSKRPKDNRRSGISNRKSVTRRSFQIVLVVAVRCSVRSCGISEVTCAWRTRFDRSGHLLRLHKSGRYSERSGHDDT